MSELSAVYLTQDRLIELERDLNHMKTAGRKEIAQKIADARAHGDLSENAEYDAAKEEQGLFEMRIAKLESMLSRAQIIDVSSLPHDIVHILATVKIRNLKTNNEFTYMLVSPEEADSSLGKISITSPIGSALMGKKAGEKVAVKAPAGIIDFELLAID